MPRKERDTNAEVIPVTPELLRSWPLSRPEDDDDKYARGTVLILGGAPDMPGAVILAANAALRAGVGKLEIATGRSIAQHVGVAVPESRIFSLRETGAGGIDPSAADILAGRIEATDATLIGPGMLDTGALRELVERLLPRLEHTVLILDATVLTCGPDLPDLLRTLGVPKVLTPHAGEAATLLGVDKDEVTADPLGTARRAAETLQAVIVMKGAATYVTAPGGAAYCDRGGNVGLATSGSGDVLSGLIAGLAARGIDPIRAAVWGAHLHGAAGDRLAERIGPLGFFARELPGEVPGLMAELEPPSPG